MKSRIFLVMFLSVALSCFVPGLTFARGGSGGGMGGGMGSSHSFSGGGQGAGFRGGSFTSSRQGVANPSQGASRQQEGIRNQDRNQLQSRSTNRERLRAGEAAGTAQGGDSGSRFGRQYGGNGGQEQQRSATATQPTAGGAAGVPER